MHNELAIAAFQLNVHGKTPRIAAVAGSKPDTQEKRQVPETQDQGGHTGQLEIDITVLLLQNLHHLRGRFKQFPATPINQLKELRFIEDNLPF